MVQAVSVSVERVQLHLVAQTAAMVATAVRYGLRPITMWRRCWPFATIPTVEQATGCMEWVRIYMVVAAKKW